MMKGCTSIYVSALFISAFIVDAHADQTIFRCEIDGKITYSDKACADAAEKTAITDTSPNSYSVEEPTHHLKSATPKKAAHRTASIAEEQIRHKERCKELADQIDAITTKLWRDDDGRKRAASLDKLRNKQQKLEQQQHVEKCH